MFEKACKKLERFAEPPVLPKSATRLLKLDCRELSALPVVVEEVEEFLSTANDTGPQTASATEAASGAADAAPSFGDAPTDIGKIYSGPRFLARIDLEYDEEKHQPKPRKSSSSKVRLQRIPVSVT